MQIGYRTEKLLIDMINVWMSTTRMQKHLYPDSRIIMWYGDSTLLFSLSNLSKAYQEKHINPNIAEYGKALLIQITPILIQWCKKSKIEQIDISFIFRTEQGTYNTSKVIRVPKDDKEMRNYLENKST